MRVTVWKGIKDYSEENEESGTNKFLTVTGSQEKYCGADIMPNDSGAGWSLVGNIDSDGIQQCPMKIFITMIDYKKISPLYGDRAG